MSDPSILISEIFGPTVQGEGAHLGQPTVFVRTAGCDYRCSWCDTLYAVDPVHKDQWRKQSPDEIWAEVERLSGGVPLTVSVSGGNPALQPLGPFIALARANGYPVMMETQGSKAQDWFASLSALTLSPKGPSSGEDTDWQALQACLKAAGETCAVTLKVVVMDRADYLYAKDVAARFPDLPLYLQAGNPEPDAEQADLPALMAGMREIVGWVTQDQWFDAIVRPQMHVLLWGNEAGV